MQAVSIEIQDESQLKILRGAIAQAGDQPNWEHPITLEIQWGANSWNLLIGQGSETWLLDWALIRNWSDLKLDFADRHEVYDSCLLASVENSPLVKGLAFGNACDRSNREEYKLPRYQEIAALYGQRAIELGHDECRELYDRSRVSC